MWLDPGWILLLVENRSTLCRRRRPRRHGKASSAGAWRGASWRGSRYVVVHESKRATAIGVCVSCSCPPGGAGLVWSGLVWYGRERTRDSRLAGLGWFWLVLPSFGLWLVTVTATATARVQTTTGSVFVGLQRTLLSLYTTTSNVVTTRTFHPERVREISKEGREVPIYNCRPFFFFVCLSVRFGEGGLACPLCVLSCRLVVLSACFGLEPTLLLLLALRELLRGCGC